MKKTASFSRIEASGGRHRHDRHLRCNSVLGTAFVHGPQQESRAPYPVGQGRAIKSNALAGVNLGLAIPRKVIGELRYQHVPFPRERSRRRLEGLQHRPQRRRIAARRHADRRPAKLDLDRHRTDQDRRKAQPFSPRHSAAARLPPPGEQLLRRQPVPPRQLFTWRRMSLGTRASWFVTSPAC
jgi:hypothetical protein